MRSSLKVFMATALAMAPTIAVGQAYTGKVSIDTVQALAGEHVAVPVRLSNSNQPISALTVPLKFSTSALTVDSVSFSGSILPAEFYGQWQVDNASREIRILVSPYLQNPVPTITGAGGLVATIFFHISPAAIPGAISVDSIDRDSIVLLNATPIHLLTQVEAASQNGMATMVPSFRAGAVVVKSPTAVDEGEAELPHSFTLAQNHPNPFNPATIIEFSLPRAGQVHLDVFNILGQSVVSLINQTLPAGQHTVEFDGSGLTSGIYFYRLDFNGANLTRKMTLLK
ncbi:MAG TPA: T9SS type A sorting domain-containing protein [Candidatus Deferrimicrobium sp.]|nr:T9SS type A sorting domain-containing protein [Candidatus Deferrimicrobium sp.]